MTARPTWRTSPWRAWTWRTLPWRAWTWRRAWTWWTSTWRAAAWRARNVSQVVRFCHRRRTTTSLRQTPPLNRRTSLTRRWRGRYCGASPTVRLLPKHIRSPLTRRRRPGRTRLCTTSSARPTRPWCGLHSCCSDSWYIRNFRFSTFDFRFSIRCCSRFFSALRWFCNMRFIGGRLPERSLPYPRRRKDCCRLTFQLCFVFFQNLGIFLNPRYLDVRIICHFYD